MDGEKKAYKITKCYTTVITSDRTKKEKGCDGCHMLFSWFSYDTCKEYVRILSWQMCCALSIFQRAFSVVADIGLPLNRENIDVPHKKSHITLDTYKGK